MPEWKQEILRRIAPLRLWAAREAEIVEELSLHLADRYQELLASGESEASARRKAAEELEDEDLLARGLKPVEREKEMEPMAAGSGGGNFIGSIAHDLRYAWRMIRKSPGFAAVAILTLALGIGANTAIFSLIDGILLKRLPVPEPQNLLVMQWHAHKDPKLQMMMSNGDCNSPYADPEVSGCELSRPFYDALAAKTDIFSGVAAFADAGGPYLTGNGPASIVKAEVVTGGYFSTLGVGAADGRMLQPSDDTATATPVAVLRYGYWRSAFGGAPSVIGKTIELNKTPVRIVGVADKSFASLSPGTQYDVWLPISMWPKLSSYWSPVQDSPKGWVRDIVARAKPGVSRQQAQAAANVLFANQVFAGDKAIFQKADNPQLELVPAPRGLAGNLTAYSQPLLVLMIAVGIILLIACANVAGLLLARASARQKEMAVRLALGAGRWRIVRQMLTESVLLAVAGGALGVLFAVWGTRAIMAVLSGGSTDASTFVFAAGIDVRVLLFTLAASVITGIVFGCAPAIRATRVNLTPALKEGTGASAASGRDMAGRWFSLGNGLVVAQVALAVVVLVGAGLLVRTLRNLRAIDLGFDAQNVLLFNLNPQQAGYETDRIDSLYTDLTGRLRGIPGVKSVGYSMTSLLGGAMVMSMHMPGTPEKQQEQIHMLPIGPGFLDTMRIHLVAGRELAPADFILAAESDRAQRLLMRPPAPGATGANAPKPSVPKVPVPVIVNETFARKYLPNQNPLGARVGETANQAGYIVVGMVSDAKYDSLQDAIPPTVYSPLSGGQAEFELKTVADPRAMIGAVRETVSSAANLPIADVSTQSADIDGALVQQRLIARLSGFFGVLALALACIGLYGLLAYEVARRTREIGIRIALGAQRGNVLRLVVTQGITLAIVGAAVGIGAALGVTRYLSTMLYGVKASDPMTFAGVAVTLAIVALAACYIPARRAMRVDPMEALRYE